MKLCAGSHPLGDEDRMHRIYYHGNSNEEHPLPFRKKHQRAELRGEQPQGLLNRNSD